MTYLFASALSDGSIDFKQPIDAPGQPGIGDLCVIVCDDDLDPIYRIAEPSAFQLNRLFDLLAGGGIFVAHNAQHVFGHLRAVMTKIGIDACDGRVQTVCTMVNLNGHVTKFNGKKGWPTLNEACAHFGIERAGTESAADNAECVRAVYRDMLKIVSVEPKIFTPRSPK